MCHPFCPIKIVKISFLSHIISFQVNAPLKDFLTVITNFFGSLKSKGRWLFNKSSVKIFWFQALWKPRFENKRNFWINCVCIKTFASWHTYMNIHVMTYPQRGIYIMTHISWTFTSWHTHKGAFTSWHTYMDICIMTSLHKKAFASKKRGEKNLALHNILFAFIENWQLGQWLRAYQ